MESAQFGYTILSLAASNGMVGVCKAVLDHPEFTQVNSKDWTSATGVNKKGNTVTSQHLQCLRFKCQCNVCMSAPMISLACYDWIWTLLRPFQHWSENRTESGEKLWFHMVPSVSIPRCQGQMGSYSPALGSSFESGSGSLLQLWFSLIDTRIPQGSTTNWEIAIVTQEWMSAQYKYT